MVKILFLFSLFSLLMGTVGRIPAPIPYVSFQLTDIAACLWGIVLLARLRESVAFLKTDTASRRFLIFWSIAAVSLLLSPIPLSWEDRLVASGYLFRLLLYFCIYPAVCISLRTYALSARFVRWGLICTGILLAAIGWIQYALYPDLRNLAYLGWDPHFNRIFGTYLDPNYFGLIMVLSLILVVTIGLLDNWLIGLLLFITLLFTYSRSSFAALFISAGYLAAQSGRRLMFGVVAAAFALSLFFLPRPAGVGVRLERTETIASRLTSWQEGLDIFSAYPILGIGFNTLRQVRASQDSGLPNTQEHSGAGIENSLLFVAATTGLIGLLAFLWFLSGVWGNGSREVRAAGIAVIIHSLFVNSLFFPSVMLWLWLLAGISAPPPPSKNRK